MSRFWETFVGTIGGAAVVAVVTVVGFAVASWRARNDRYEAHLKRIVDKRYELYAKYKDILDRNASHFIDPDAYSGPEVTVAETQAIENDMRLFASAEVLAISDSYRDVVRRAASTGVDLTEQGRERLRWDSHLAGSLVLAAMRADLGIESLSFGSARSRMRTFKRLAGEEISQYAQRTANLISEEE